MLSLLIIRRDRTAIDLSGVGIALIGRFIGTAVAAAIILILPQDILFIIIGSLILLGVIMSFAKPSWNTIYHSSGRQRPYSHRNFARLGFIGNDRDYQKPFLLKGILPRWYLQRLFHGLRGVDGGGVEQRHVGVRLLHQ